MAVITTGTVKFPEKLAVADTDYTYPWRVRRAAGSGAYAVQIDSVFGSDRDVKHHAIPDNGSDYGGQAFYYQNNAGTQMLGLGIVRGVIVVGTTMRTSAAAGDVVIPNTQALRGVNAAGTDTLPMIRLNASNQTELVGTLSMASPGSPAGVTGGASYALPATPATYVVVYLGGSKFAFPVYNAT
jgi:hypothetical protein